jgi:lysophospholipase L1-like esterase
VERWPRRGFTSFKGKTLEAGQSKVRPAHRWWARPLLLLASIFFALLVGEVAIRLAGLAPKPIPIDLEATKSVYQRSANPIMGYELKPNYTDRLADTHLSLPKTNSDGQRDIERPIERRPGVPRILLLGDSVVAGHGIYELEETISRQLEGRFPPGSVEVLNFGVGGYCTLAEVELLKTKGLKYKPDIVVLLFLGNDYTNLNARVHMYASVHPRAGWINQCFLHSHIFRLVAIRLNLFGFGDDWQPEERHAKAVGPDNVERGIEQLKQLADDDHFRPIVVLWPGFDDGRLIDVWHEPKTTDPHAVLRFAEQWGIPTAGLMDYFRQDAEAVGGNLNYRVRYSIGDTLHPSPRGAAVAALGLEDILRRQFPDVFANVPRKSP